MNWKRDEKRESGKEREGKNEIERVKWKEGKENRERMEERGKRNGK